MDTVKTGLLIAQARKEKALTQRDVAQALHVSTQAVSKWERGLNCPDLALLEPLAELLGLSISELLSGARGAQPQEPLVRDTLRTLVLQMERGVRRWRRLFFAALLLALALLLGGGYRYVRDNTSWLPQRSTLISPRTPTDSELLAATAAGSFQLCLFDLTIADQADKLSVWLEEWTGEGLVWHDEIGSLEQPAPFPRRQLLALSWDNRSWDSQALTLGLQLHLSSSGTLVSARHTFDRYPDSGFGLGVLNQSAAVSPEHGVVLACFSLDAAGTGHWSPPEWVGDVDAPTVEEGEAFLLLRLRCEETDL